MEGLIVGALVRHGLGALGAVLVTQGWADEATAQQLTGAVMTLGAFGLSLKDKLRR